MSTGPSGVEESSVLVARSVTPPTACFRSFPFPEWSGESLTQVREISEHIANVRMSLARRDSIGLTELYNRFHDRDCQEPEIENLRLSHEKLDHAVAQAYGWSDLNLSRGWYSTFAVMENEDEDPDEREDEVWRYAIGEESRELHAGRPSQAEHRTREAGERKSCPREISRSGERCPERGSCWPG